MEDIQNKAVETYQRNINYLQEKHPKIIQQLKLFDEAILRGDNKEKYALEYTNGGFDIQELATGNYLYSKNSTNISKEFVKQVNFDKEKSIIEGMPILYIPENKKLNDKEEGRLGLYPVMRYYIDHTFKENLHYFKEIKKYIFLGVGLGLHITEIDKRIKAKNYFIIEDDIEFFKLSLFTTDYSHLAQTANLYFSIADNKENFMQIFSKYLTDSSFDNRLLKYTHFGIHSDKKIQDMQYVVSTQSFHVFPYRTHLEKFIRPLNFMDGENKFLNFANKFKNTLFEKQPVILLGAGPSLQKNIQWLKENQNKFIIVAVSATLKTLYKNDIKPDIIVHVDGFNDSLVHFKDIDTKEYLKNTIAIFESFTPLKIRSYFKKEQIFTISNLVDYFEGIQGIPATCVGSFSFNMLISMNTKNLYLLGLDLALDKESGQTHSAEHGYSKKLDIENKNLSQPMNMKKNILYVEGNFSPEVPTVSEFALSISTINNYIKTVKSNEQIVYNLSDGAKFNNTTPLQPSSIQLEPIDKNKLFTQINNALTPYSLTKLNENDILSMKKRFQDAKNIKNLIDKYTHKHFSSSDTFLYELMGFYIELLKKQTREENNLVYIYMNYFNYLIPILVDYFNTKNLKHPKKDIKKFTKMIYPEIYAISNIYLDALEKFLYKIDKKG